MQLFGWKTPKGARTRPTLPIQKDHCLLILGKFRVCSVSSEGHSSHHSPRDHPLAACQSMDQFQHEQRGLESQADIGFDPSKGNPFAESSRVLAESCSKVALCRGYTHGPSVASFTHTPYAPRYAGITYPRLESAPWTICRHTCCLQPLRVPATWSSLYLCLP
jgi:hypothetical protein